MTSIYPVRSWDSKSSTAELLELFHTMRTCFEDGQGVEEGGKVTEEQFSQKRAFLIWGVQSKKVTFHLFSDGVLDAHFTKDELDKVEAEEEA